MSGRDIGASVRQRLLKASFAKVTSATGLADPEAIVNKFFFKSDIKDQLQREIDAKRRHIEALRASETELKAQLA